MTLTQTACSDTYSRRDEKFLELFKAAGLRLVKSEIQKGMPKELFPVKTYALR